MDMIGALMMTMLTATSTQMVRPADNGAALDNPGMGWVLHYYDNAISCYGTRLEPSDTVDDFPGLTTIYLRLAWSHIEPEEGVFDWSIVDAPAQRWISKGKRVAFRFSCSESGRREGTPAWVRDAGAKVYPFKPGKGVSSEEEAQGRWEPDFNDPIFLEKLSNFLAAAAARYDGDPTVDFIDVGSFGVWGEGHTFWSTKKTYDADTVIRHIDLHRKHFKNTPLVANWTWTDHGRGPRALDYSAEKGLWFRSDSILVMHGDELYKPEQAEPFWRDRPVVLESQHYGNSVRDGVWGDGSGYLKAVEDYHASYASIHWWPREFLEEQHGLIEAINRKLGYRLQLVEATLPREVRIREAFAWRTEWRNAGVAPCLPGGFPCLTLKDARGGIVAVFVDESFDVRALALNGEAVARSEVSVRVPGTVTPGRYEALVSIGSRTGTPGIALPLDGGDGQRRYRVGAVEVLPGE